MLPLFDDLPPGFSYREGFLGLDEARDLHLEIRALTFAEFEMRGVVARRRVAFFGESYPGSAGPAAPIPPFLWPLRDRIAAWADQPPGAFAMVLVNEYRPGAPIGWHRDAPQYDIVSGVSLGAPCRMRFRPYVFRRTGAHSSSRPPRRATHELTLMPRSAYLMAGESRSAFEHSIPPVDGLRYSITFRTFRDRRTGG